LQLRTGTVPKSKLESLARSLRGVSVALLVVFVIASLAAVDWVNTEFAENATFWRYISAIAEVGTFLIAAVVAWVGGALVQAIGRVRASMLAAMYESENGQGSEFERSWKPERVRHEQ
jgi:hypothetical protein